MEEKSKELEAQETPATETQASAPEKKAAFFSRKNLKRNIILGASLVVVAAIIALVLTALSPKAVAKKYCLAVWNGDPAQEARYLAYDGKALIVSTVGDEEDFYEKVSEVNSEDIHSWNAYAKMMREKRREDLEDEYGDYKITANVTRVKDISVRKLEEEAGWLYETIEKYGFDSDKIAAAKVVTVKMKLAGEDGTEKETIEVYMAKVGGLWKVVTTE